MQVQPATGRPTRGPSPMMAVAMHGVFGVLTRFSIRGSFTTIADREAGLEFAGTHDETGGDAPAQRGLHTPSPRA